MLGSVILSDTFASYGDTSAGKPVTFAVKAGATLAVERSLEKLATAVESSVDLRFLWGAEE